MNDDERLEQFIALCQRIYERMKREGTWPWSDSPKSEDSVESDSNPESI